MLYSPQTFRQDAEAEGHSEVYIEKCLAYINLLQSRGYLALFSPFHFAKEIGMPLRILKRFADQSSVYYSYFKMPKRKGGYREIMAPYQKLKFVQRWIDYNILRNFPLHPACTSFRQGISIVDNARYHANARIVLKVDLLKFYDTITEKRVYGVFEAMGYVGNVAYLLAALCTSTHRNAYWNALSSSEKEKFAPIFKNDLGILPQGAPSSPMLANIVATTLDKKLDRLAQLKGFRYSRYADDLTFSIERGTDGVLPSLSLIEKIVEEEGFFINPDKVGYYSQGNKQYVTGLTVTHGINVSKKYRKYIAQQLHFARKFGPTNHLQRISQNKSGNTERPMQGFQDWILGHILFIRSVNKAAGTKLMEQFNKVDWSN